MCIAAGSSTWLYIGRFGCASQSGLDPEIKKTSYRQLSPSTLKDSLQADDQIYVHGGMFLTFCLLGDLCKVCVPAETKETSISDIFRPSHHELHEQKR